MWLEKDGFVPFSFSYSLWLLLVSASCRIFLRDVGSLGMVG